MKYNYVFFDFDGTLADTEKMNYEIMQNLSSKYKLKEVSYEELREMKHLSAMEFMKYMNIKKRSVPFILRKGRKLLYNNIQDVKLCKDNFNEVLNKLSDLNVKIGIITTNSKKNVIKFLETHNIEVFNFIISASLFGKKSKIRKLIKKEGISPSSILYVGDEIRDIVSARASNISIASVTWGYNTAEALSDCKPDYLVNDPAELIDICLQN